VKIDKITSLLKRAFQYAHFNCPEDDDGIVRYHSNCQRGLKPILQELADELRSEELADWQMIETAPKGSKYILVWCPERQNQYMVTWNDSASKWDVFGSFGNSLNEVATQWRPLPKLPK
jgi:hypothetical protein